MKHHTYNRKQKKEKTKMVKKSPTYPSANPTPEALCAHWKAMDAYYGDNIYSPLHHDNRCKLCLSK